MAAIKFEKDKGYAWVILLCAFLARTIDCSILTTVGIFMLEYLEYFNVDKAFTITALVSSYFVAMALSGPIGGLAMKYLGVRPVMLFGITLVVIMLLIAGTFPSICVLAICYSFCGLGFQLSSLGVIVNVQLYFDKRRSFASGVMMSGLSCGTFIWPPLMRLMIDMYTWRGALYILAGVAAQTYICILLMRPPPESSKVPHPTENGTNNNPKNQDSDLQKPKSNKLQYFTWGLYTLCLLTQCIGHFVPMNYFPMKGHQDGIDKDKVPILVSVIGGMGIISRPIAGYVSDRFINRLTLAIFSLILCGSLLIVAAFLHTFVPFLMVCLFLGIIQSLYIGTISAQWVDIYGLENIAFGSGLGAFSIGISTAILHPIAGTLLDLTGSTQFILFVFGGVQIFSSVLLLAVKLLLRYQQNLTSTYKETNIALSSTNIMTI